MLNRVNKLISRIQVNILGTEFTFRVVELDRCFIQVVYAATCTKTGQPDIYRGRKWFLSQYMTNDEIVKTAYLAIETAVKHEILEGFKVDGKSLFNPHLDFEELLKVTKEVKRVPHMYDHKDPRDI